MLFSDAGRTVIRGAPRRQGATWIMASDHDGSGPARRPPKQDPPRSPASTGLAAADDFETTSAPASPLAAPDTDAGRLGPHLLKSWLLLLVSDRPSYGYQLVEALVELGIHLGNSGYVYRTLRAMEAAGVLASAWQHSGAGPPHRVYRLTSAGYQALDHCATGMCTFDALLHDYLSRYQKARGDGWPADEPATTGPAWLAGGQGRSVRGRRGRMVGDA
ncbi:MAG: PadR family transcriptional regulator [Acidimicrobiales bacterium]